MTGGRAIAEMMSLTLDDLFASPDHYLHSFEGDAALFMPMDRAAYHRSIFLDGRISPAANQLMRLPVGALTRQVPKPAPTDWIFHVAHCGSTLLARALDQLSANLVLREPFALRQLGLEPKADRLALVAAMLSKRYQKDRPTIVKANVPVNFVLPDLVAFDGDARAIFLHCNLRDYLLAILRNEKHREWMRRVTSDLAAHLGDVSPLPDDERAAALWLAQMRAFEAAILRLPNARTLEAEAFFTDPARYVKLAAEHLQVPMTGAEVDETVSGPLFATYSKNPELPFDNEMRLARLSEVAESMRPELDQAQAWVERQAGEATPTAATIAAARLQD